jgi:hypothetical protein
MNVDSIGLTTHLALGRRLCGGFGLIHCSGASWPGRCGQQHLDQCRSAEGMRHEPS